MKTYTTPFGAINEGKTYFVDIYLSDWQIKTREEGLSVQHIMIKAKNEKVIYTIYASDYEVINLTELTFTNMVNQALMVVMSGYVTSYHPERPASDIQKQYTAMMARQLGAA